MSEMKGRGKRKEEEEICLFVCLFVCLLMLKFECCYFVV